MKTIRPAIFFLLMLTGLVCAQSGADIEKKLIGTRWDVSVELGQRAWGDLRFREGREFSTMNGPNGAWKATGPRTVELGSMYVLEFTPELESFVVTRKAGGKIATGKRNGATASFPMAIVIAPAPPATVPAVPAGPASRPAMPSVPPVATVPDPLNLNRARALTDRPLGISLPPPGNAQPGVQPSGPQTVPAAMLARFSRQERAVAMERNKMKSKTELAVLKGLGWLQKNQSADGSWGNANKGAMTGFALLCFLGHGETPASEQFGSTVRKGIDWLVKTGSAGDGRFATFNQPGVYEHAIATYALAEYQIMTGDATVVPLLKKAVGYIVSGQGNGGGWIYSYDKSGDDLSVSGWQIQALRAAHLSRLNIAGVDQALDKASAYIDRVKGPKGGYGYRSAGDKYSLSGIGILCQLNWKVERASLRKGIEWVLSETERDYPVVYGDAKADLYAWYYHTQACCIFGGAAWAKWNRWFQDEIVDAQATDGSWPQMGSTALSSLQGGGSDTAAVYRAALCTLMLEAFYRYLPNEGFVVLPGAQPAFRKP